MLTVSLKMFSFFDESPYRVEKITMMLRPLESTINILLTSRHSPLRKENLLTPTSS